MSAKITLITPPDIFQNDQLSILFLDLSEDEQDAVTHWLANSQDIGINIYYYQGETNIPWFLHAISCTNFKYVSLNNMSAVTSYMVGYVLSKSNVYYRTDDVNIAELFSHINNNRVHSVTDFLERILRGKK